MIGPPVMAIFMLESVNRHTEASSMCILYDRPAGCGDIHVTDNVFNEYWYEAKSLECSRYQYHH